VAPSLTPGIALREFAVLCWTPASGLCTIRAPLGCHQVCMAKEEAIQMEGEVVETLPNTTFRVQL
jgi:hypothetical protein